MLLSGGRRRRRAESAEDAENKLARESLSLVLTHTVVIRAAPTRSITYKNRSLFNEFVQRQHVSRDRRASQTRALSTRATRGARATDHATTRRRHFSTTMIRNASFLFKFVAVWLLAGFLFAALYSTRTSPNVRRRRPVAAVALDTVDYVRVETSTAAAAVPKAPDDDDGEKLADTGFVSSLTSSTLLSTPARRASTTAAVFGTSALSSSTLPRILCWVLTNPNNLQTRSRYVQRTWAPRCDKTIFFSSVANASFPAIGLNVSGVETKNNNALKAGRAWQHVYDNYIDDYDWFMKTGEREKNVQCQGHVCVEWKNICTMYCI